jgi:hypothetical protein
MLVLLELELNSQKKSLRMKKKKNIQQTIVDHLMGIIMKSVPGANPEIVKEILIEQLEQKCLESERSKHESHS